jgi:hypothetical protein
MLPASFPNLQSLTVQACFVGNRRALLEKIEKIAAENPVLKIHLC